jgi:putative tryptophan/tyrosine transport system substrate-binding protein
LSRRTGFDVALTADDVMVRDVVTTLGSSASLVWRASRSDPSMKRREFLGAAATLFLFHSSASAAEGMRRVGYLSAGSPITDDSPTSGPVIEGLKRLGWIEGGTIRFERRAANGDNLLPKAFRQSWHPAGAGDRVALGLVASFNHPGGNITGISDLAGELAPKRLSLKEILPSIRKVAMLWNGSDRAMGQRYQLSAASASSLDLSVQPLTVREANDFDAAFSKMERDPPDAGFMVVDGLTGSNRNRVIQFAATHRIPFMYEDDFSRSLTSRSERWLGRDAARDDDQD